MFHEEINSFLENINKTQLDVVTEESKLYSFNLELAKFIIIKNSAFIDSIKKDHS